MNTVSDHRAFWIITHLTTRLFNQGISPLFPIVVLWDRTRLLGILVVISLHQLVHFLLEFGELGEIPPVLLGREVVHVVKIIGAEPVTVSKTKLTFKWDTHVSHRKEFRLKWFDIITIQTLNFRESLTERSELSLLHPPLRYCSDAFSISRYFSQFVLTSTGSSLTP